LEAIVLRYFTVYGERQRPDMAFSAFIAAGIGEPTAKLLSAGEHQRHFTYVGDAVEATLRALRAPSGRIYNVAGPRPAVVIDALRLIEEYLKKPVPVVRLPAFDGEARSTSADLSAVYKDLRWQPHVELADGLQRQINHALAQHTHPASAHTQRPLTG
jgi:nucleoside-diphosphate-sugar epimerase